MPIRKFNPTSPGQRFQTVQTFDEITTSEPHKALVEPLKSKRARNNRRDQTMPRWEPLKSTGGRNTRGELTSWWRGGGHKRMYRVIDFKRDKREIQAKVSTVEDDPKRSARLALLT